MIHARTGNVHLGGVQLQMFRDEILPAVGESALEIVGENFAREPTRAVEVSLTFNGDDRDEDFRFVFALLR